MPSLCIELVCEQECIKDKVYASLQPTAELLLENSVSNLLEEGKALQEQWQQQHDQSDQQEPVSTLPCNTLPCKLERGHCDVACNCTWQRWHKSNTALRRSCIESWAVIVRQLASMSKPCQHRCYRTLSTELSVQVS